MTDQIRKKKPAIMTADITVPFRYSIIHGLDPGKKSPEQKAVTKALNMVGLIFGVDKMEKDGFHLSFTENSYSRNILEISLDLGAKSRNLELLGQVDWYERRLTSEGNNFMVGVSFVDPPADALEILKEFLRSSPEPYR
jgi:hypothetical protein